MMTDEDRRKVARKLREYVDMPDGWWQETLPHFYIEKCVFGDLTSHGEDELFARLADLIEPKPERMCRDTSPLVYKFTCSECHSSYRFGCEHGVWYCPYCGAKVVGND